MPHKSGGNAIYVLIVFFVSAFSSLMSWLNKDSKKKVNEFSTKQKKIINAITHSFIGGLVGISSFMLVQEYKDWEVMTCATVALVLAVLSDAIILKANERIMKR